MRFTKIVFMKQNGFELDWVRTAELDAPAYPDAAFLRLFSAALRPYQRVGIDDKQETLTVALVALAAHGNRPPVDEDTIIALIEGKKQLADVLGDRLI